MTGAISFLIDELVIVGLKTETHQSVCLSMYPFVGEAQHNEAESEGRNCENVLFFTLPDTDEQEGNQDSRDEDDFWTVVCWAFHTFQICYTASSCFRVPPKLPKIVAEQNDVEDDGADDGKGKQPYSGTDSNGDWCPGIYGV